jgi:hypothetical protein
MCSTFKWALAAAVLASVDHGETALDQHMTYDAGSYGLRSYDPRPCRRRSLDRRSAVKGMSFDDRQSHAGNGWLLASVCMRASVEYRRRWAPAVGSRRRNARGVRKLQSVSNRAWKNRRYFGS